MRPGTLCIFDLRHDASLDCTLGRDASLDNVSIRFYWRDASLDFCPFNVDKMDETRCVISHCDSWWGKRGVLKKTFFCFFLYEWESILLFRVGWKNLLLNVLVKFWGFCEKIKKIRLFVLFEWDTEADGHDSTECTSVLWTRCVMELTEATRWVASQTDRKRKNLEGRTIF